MDAKYTIEARVVDASRREERGTGSVIAARRPFEVVVWTNRGYARAGDDIEATISAATLAGKPVVGAKGTLKIYQLVDERRRPRRSKRKSSHGRSTPMPRDR